MEKEDLKLGTKEAQLNLLHQVLAASDADAEEEDIKEESFDGTRETKVCLFYDRFFSSSLFVEAFGLFLASELFGW